MLLPGYAALRRLWQKLQVDKRASVHNRYTSEVREQNKCDGIRGKMLCCDVM